MKKIELNFSEKSNTVHKDMGRKARNAGTAGHRERTCYKLAEKSVFDTSNVRMSGGGSRSANRKANKEIVRERIERINEMMRQNAITDVQNELTELEENAENLTNSNDTPESQETVITVTS